MVWKLAALILIGASAGATLLVVRQQRLQAVHEMTQAAERMIEMERALWRLRTEVAARVTPERLASDFPPETEMEPIPLEWCLPDGTPVSYISPLALGEPRGPLGGGTRRDETR